MICFWHGKAINENQRKDSEHGRINAGKVYEAIEESVAQVCKANFPKFTGPVSVRLFMMLSPKMDAQKVIKPCLDALELAGVIENDRQVRHFSFYRENRRPNEQDSIGIAVTQVKESGQGTIAGGKAGKQRAAHPVRRGGRRLQVSAKAPALKPGG
jgi:Holliday junction resolvase RusA-like endonuclease